MHPRRLYEILLASFGAIAFFRTSFFTARIGGADIGIGPSALLQSLLGAADRMIDRDQAQGRADGVAKIMREVEFRKAQAALPSLCFILVESLSVAEQQQGGEQIKQLVERKDIDDESKSILLGVYLIRFVGADVLEDAVSAMGGNIARRSAPANPPVPPGGA
jgi:hypothetical protein